MKQQGARQDWLLAALGALVILYRLPFVRYSPYVLHMMILLFLSTIMGESWNIIGGYTGQYSVGHSAYFGAGAYGTLILLQSKGIPPWYGFLAGIIVALVLSLIIGSICFRLRGPYFVLASIAVAEIVRLTVLNLPILTKALKAFCFPICRH